MKKTLMMCGSPRKLGNASTMTGLLAESLNSNSDEIRKVHLYDYEIKPCIDCRTCKKDNSICTIEDDMQLLYPQIEDADILIFATPIYWFSPTAKTKLMLDRLRPYFVNKKLNGKKSALLLPAGSGSGDCDLTIEMFKRIFEALKIDFIGTVTAEVYDIGDVNQNDEVKRQISELAQNIHKHL